MLYWQHLLVLLGLPHPSTLGSLAGGSTRHHRVAGSAVQGCVRTTCSLEGLSWPKPLTTTFSQQLQAGWCYFQNTGPDKILCLLQDAALTVYTQDGDSHIIPLPGRFTAMWPLPQGVLLTVSGLAGMQEGVGWEIVGGRQVVWWTGGGVGESGRREPFW